MTTGDVGHTAARRRDVFVVAACFALLAGAIEAALAGLHILVLHRFAWVAPDVAWMAPLAYLVFFLPPAVALAVVSLVLRRPMPLAVSVGVFAALAMFSQLLPYGEIAPWASALLSAGAGVQFGRLAGSNPARWTVRLRRASLALAALVVVTGAGIRGWRAWNERRALAQLPAASPGAPNVLVIILDTVRRSSLHLYGYDRATTPQLDRRARESAVFDHAIAPSPWTLPSHASLLTGQPATALSHGWYRPFGAGPATLAEVLGSRGYVTGGFVANFLYTSFESGLARGFAHYDDFPVSRNLVRLHSAYGRSVMVERLTRSTSPGAAVRALLTVNMKPALAPADAVRPADSVSDAFLAWQRDAGRRPFFAFLNYFDAHGPYRAPDEFLTRFHRAASPSRDLDKYDAAIAWLDSEIGRVLDSLAARGVLDNTIVIVTADHGEQFGEHGLRSHANSLYLPLLAVPLLIRYPAAVPAGRRIGSLVTLHDLAATLLDLAGAPAELPGASLARYWRAGADPAPSVVMADVDQSKEADTTLPNARGPMQAILDERLHYVQGGRGGDELYAWRDDSLELRNLAGDPAWQAELVRLRDRLGAARAEARRRR